MEAARHPFPVSSTARTIGEQKAKVKSISKRASVHIVDKFGLLGMDGHEGLYRRGNGTWQVARLCSADRGHARSQNGRCLLGSRRHARSQNGRCLLGSREVFAVVEVRGSQELNELVMDQIQRLVGVRETSTHSPRLVAFRPTSSSSQNLAGIHLSLISGTRWIQSSFLHP